MTLYPGGTWWNPGARGASFWQNYLCDLTQPVAIDRVGNPVGSILARAAMLVLVVGLLPLWGVAPGLFRRSRLAGAVRVLGFASMTGLVPVILLPSSRVGALHGALVILAGLPGLAAATLSVVGLFASDRRCRLAATLGAAMLGVAALDFVAYVAHVAAGGIGTPLLPSLQKIALVLLMAWMLSVASTLWTAQARPR